MHPKYTGKHVLIDSFKEIPPGYAPLREVKDFHGKDKYRDVGDACTAGLIPSVKFRKPGLRGHVYVDSAAVDKWLESFDSRKATQDAARYSRASEMGKAPKGITREFITGEVDRLIAALKEVLS